MGKGLREGLERCRLLAGLPASTLDALSAAAEWRELRGGETLFEAGTASDSLYVVYSGRLAVELGSARPPVEVAMGATLGEIGVLTRAPRMATTVAVRDSVLIRIDAGALLQTLEQHPHALLAFTRLIVERLQQPAPDSPTAGAQTVRTLALLPGCAGADAREVAEGLQRALSEQGRTALVDAAGVDEALGAGSADIHFDAGAANSRLVEWLNRQEREVRHVIYLGGADAAPWTRRCLRQADRVLLVLPGDAPTQPCAVLDALAQMQIRAPRELVLTGRADTPACDVLGWRECSGARFHHWLEGDTPEAYRRLARQVSGRALGLVLGGGGARGFAHIGLLRALAERGIAVDLAGGTSMGAFIAALHVAGMQPDEIAQAARDAFVHRSLLNDYVLPRVSLIRGRKFLRHMESLFGDRQIESLGRPFYCVSTNLTQGKAMVHDRGPLALWVATSMCVPGIAPPLVHRGELLADGAVVNSLPVDVMVSLGRGPIVASNVGSEGGLSLDGVEGPDPEALLTWRGKGRRPGLADILFRTATLTSDLSMRAHARSADVYIRPPLKDVGMFEWGRLDELVQRGYEHALQVLDAQAHKLA